MRHPGFLQAFCQRRDGAVAVVFGLSVMVLLTAAGVAMDYARAYAVQTTLQNDLDAAVLGAATRMSESDDLTSLALGYFDANWRAKHAVGTVELNVVRGAGQLVTGTATATVPTTLMKIAGFNSVTIAATSEVELTAQDVEVALVLDTTGSMSGPKIGALKDAARGLIQSAYSKPDSEAHIKIGIVPFAEYVNVGVSRRNESWLDAAPDSSSTQESCSHVAPVTGTSNCRMETFSGSDDGVPYTYQSEVCDHAYGPPELQCTSTTSTSTFNGCVGSRDNPLDTNDENYATRVPGLSNVWCGAELTPLTNDKDMLETGIDALSAADQTYIPAGLMWGWTLLSAEAPFTEAVAYGAKVNGNEVRKVLVLMTDGVNTRSPSYPHHWGTDTTEANELTAELCVNIKAKNIEIFTVAFDLADGPIKDILRACASKPANYFDATGAAELETAFADIAEGFTPLRLAR